MHEFDYRFWLDYVIFILNVFSHVFTKYSKYYLECVLLPNYCESGAYFASSRLARNSAVVVGRSWAAGTTRHEMIQYCAFWELADFHCMSGTKQKGRHTYFPTPSGSARHPPSNIRIIRAYFTISSNWRRVYCRPVQRSHRLLSRHMHDHS